METLLLTFSSRERNDGVPTFILKRDAEESGHTGAWAQVIDKGGWSEEKLALVFCIYAHDEKGFFFLRDGEGRLYADEQTAAAMNIAPPPKNKKLVPAYIARR